MGRGVEQSKQNSQTKTNQEKRQRQKAPTLSTSSSSMFEERNIKKKTKMKGKTTKRERSHCAVNTGNTLSCGQSVLARKVQSRTVVLPFVCWRPGFFPNVTSLSLAQGLARWKMLLWVPFGTMFGSSASETLPLKLCSSG